MRKLCTVWLGILILSALLLSGCAQTPSDSPAASQPETKSEAPAQDETPAQDGASAQPLTFEATDTEGNSVTSDIFARSKLTMVNVWATYCGPCLNEMPDLGQLAAEYEPEEFQIIGVISDVLEGEDQELAESLIQETGADYTHLLLNESLYYALLTDVTAVPTTFFLDGEGTVLDTVVGAMEKSDWEETINGLLEEQ